MRNASVLSASASWIAAVFALAVEGQALAADLPSPVASPAAAPPATYVQTIAPVYTWSGVYLGINGGYAVGQTFFSDPAVFQGDGPFSMDGFQIGGTIGANYQWGHFVAGIESDGDWTDQSGSVSQTNWLATVRGRAGYAFDRVLFYATGGAAAANRLIAAGGNYPFSSATQIGWTAGAGVEGVLWQNWTVKIEYLYVDLGSQTCPVTSCAGAVPISVPFTENVVRAGINYRFNF